MLIRSLVERETEESDPEDGEGKPVKKNYSVRCMKLICCIFRTRSRREGDLLLTSPLHPYHAPNRRPVC